MKNTRQTNINIHRDAWVEINISNLEHNIKEIKFIIKNRVKSADKLVADYEEREKESTTGFGNGIAIPHAKSDNVNQATILFARGVNDVDWDSLDGKPVNTWISLLVPTSEGSVHLKLLAKLFMIR